MWHSMQRASCRRFRACSLPARPRCQAPMPACPTNPHSSPLGTCDPCVDAHAHAQLALSYDAPMHEQPACVADLTDLQNLWAHIVGCANRRARQAVGAVLEQRRQAEIRHLR